MADENLASEACGRSIDIGSKEAKNKPIYLARYRKILSKNSVYRYKFDQDLRAQIKRLKEAGLTPDQIEIVRKKYGETIYTRIIRSLAGTRNHGRRNKATKRSGSN